MALLQWIHLRKLVPLGELIEQLQQGGAPASGAQGGASPAGGTAARRDVAVRSGVGAAGSRGPDAWPAAARRRRRSSAGPGLTPPAAVPAPAAAARAARRSTQADARPAARIAAPPRGGVGG